MGGKEKFNPHIKISAEFEVSFTWIQVDTLGDFLSCEIYGWAG